LNDTIGNSVFLIVYQKIQIGYHNQGEISTGDCLFSNGCTGMMGGACFPDSGKLTNTIFEKNDFTNCSCGFCGGA
jgi:hypothetical protein